MTRRSGPTVAAAPRRAASLALVLTVVAMLASACAGGTPAPRTAPAARPATADPGGFIAMAAEPATLEGDAFAPTCAVPYGSVGEVRPIDNTCGPEGTGSAKSQAQNRAKNNLCAAGPTVDLNRQAFTRLQTAVNNLEGFVWGSPTALPDDRSPLRDLVTIGGRRVGEGSRVRTRGFLMHANYSNTSKGENVNCNTPGVANNDIHIYLAMTAGQDDRCESLNAEIIPHFRPDAWTQITHEDNVAPDRPMRVTGQLMLDVSHRPCAGGKRASPARFTSWEIHPVYNLEVCRSKRTSQCALSNDAAWIQFDEWLGEDEHEEEPEQD